MSVDQAHVRRLEAEVEGLQGKLLEEQARHRHVVNLLQRRIEGLEGQLEGWRVRHGDDLKCMCDLADEVSRGKKTIRELEARLDSEAAGA